MYCYDFFVTERLGGLFAVVCNTLVALLKAQVSLQLGKIFSSDNGVSVSVMYSYMH